MSFVFYDVETTGLNPRFDQILQFAAARTDAELNVLDRFDVRCRLLPHIIPAPSALLVTGSSVPTLTDPSLPSHYEMMASVRSKLAEWCPAMFLGFNSIHFDEEFLRHALYQCLHDAYLTNTNGSARADILSLARVVAALRPDVLVPYQDKDGYAVFRLANLAAANGITTTASHVAAADVDTALAICRKIRAGAPDLWSRFLQFAQKRTVLDFVSNETAFLYFQPRGNHPRARVIMRVGEHHSMANIQYCLDLQCDLEPLRILSVDGLIAAFQKSPRPLVRVHANRAPMLCPIWGGSAAQLDKMSPEEVCRQAENLKSDSVFMDRILAAARLSETSYARSSHVEEQLYDGFPEGEVPSQMLRFHEIAWGERLNLADQFSDIRYRRLARRIVYFEHPELLGSDGRTAMDQEIARRVLGKSSVPGQWMTIPAALEEIQSLLPDTSDETQRCSLIAYQDALQKRQTHHEAQVGPVTMF